ncbi:hypothetical protein SEVIR_2G133200v4 [Setaria viridis]|uniref:Bifunctional inhibitor/plant lipid transfer protein/seed storage helical domain-containing protein n=1 Tax=Setaria viridis TaxID=4556 RepID=A0A4U6VSL3_SETVI|nr:uncharacterized protein LOC117845597 [Setaria viridis]TKW31854.1 hypothetical protein SEVIR_2G133200v2 [Setaria viridis]
MASSNKHTLIALLVVFAVVAPSLPPSAAARDGGAAKAAAAPAPSASGKAVHPMDLFDDLIHDLIHFDLPLPQILPCPPVFPKIPFIPCYNYTPPPPVMECRPSLAKYMPPCSGFLTDAGVPFDRSSTNCCGVIQHFFDDRSTSPSCLCHVLNGDADGILHAPVNHTRALSLLHVCGYAMTPELFPKFCDYSDVPPMDAASPPPPLRQGTKV